MRRLIALLAAVGALVDLALTQDVSGLPPCGASCVNVASVNAQAQASCNLNHANCYCTRADFITMVKTCVSQQCSSDADKAATNAFATGYCADSKTGTNGPGSPSSSSTSHTATSTASGAASHSASSTGTAASATTTPTANKPSGLSTGAKAGIGVGAALGGLAILGLLALFLLHRRKAPAEPVRPETAEVRDPEKFAIAEDAKEIDDEPKELYVPPPVVHELGGNAVSTNSSPATLAATPSGRLSPEQHNTNLAGI